MRYSDLKSLELGFLSVGRDITEDLPRHMETFLPPTLDPFISLINPFAFWVFSLQLHDSSINPYSLLCRHHHLLKL